MGEDPTNRPVAVHLLALPESTPTVLSGLYEVLNSVGVMWGLLTGQPPGAGRFEVKIIARTPQPLPTEVGMQIIPHAAIGGLAPPDVLIVTDLMLLPGSDPRGRWPDEAPWAREAFEAGTVVCSVCTGSLFLAEAGLLDDLEATTHWCAGPTFRAFYPTVRLRTERILVASGPEQRVITAGGQASWEDLALYLIARFCGEQEAVQTAKIFIFGDRRDGQLPFAAMVAPPVHHDKLVQSCQTWLADHYAEPHPVGRLVERVELSERALNRRFKAATGYTPLEYVQRLRIEEAKQLLETTPHPVDDVAAQVGYQDAASFRRLFKRSTGITPGDYKRRFRTARLR